MVYVVIPPSNARSLYFFDPKDPSKPNPDWFCRDYAEDLVHDRQYNWVNRGSKRSGVLDDWDGERDTEY